MNDKWESVIKSLGFRTYHFDKFPLCAIPYRKEVYLLKRATNELMHEYNSLHSPFRSNLPSLSASLLSHCICNFILPLLSNQVFVSNKCNPSFLFVC